jgi:ankyrin repeat protein
LDYSRFDKLDVSDSDEEDKAADQHIQGAATKAEEVLAELPPDLPEELALVLAAREGQRNLVEALLLKRASVNSADPHGGTALLRAVEGGIANRSVIELLLSRKADLEAKSIVGDSPMNMAAARGPVPLCEALLEAGAPSADVRAAALVAAAEAHNETTSQYLLGSTRAPPSARGGDGRTALHHWAKKGHEGLVSALLAARADANACDINGISPLDCAATGGNPAVVLALCQGGALLDHAATDGTTPLVTAIGLGDEQRAENVVKTLLEQRASVEATSDPVQATLPLVAAACTGRHSLVALLLQAGASVNTTDARGRCTLPCAAAGGTLELCKLLLEHRADVNAKSTSGQPQGYTGTATSVGDSAFDRCR